MNREERRNLGISKETSESLAKFEAPCTIKETIQISRAAAQDAVEEALIGYQKRTSPLQVAISLQVEILKDAIIKAGIISEEEFRNIYMEKAEEFNQMQRDYRDLQEDSPKMGLTASGIDVKVEE